MLDTGNDKAPISSEILPNRLSFALKMRKVLSERPQQNPPPLPDEPKASDVAAHANVDWKKFQEDFRRKGKSKGLGGYIYDLAKFMSKPPPPEERAVILVSSSWGIYDGRARTLALKVLGPDFVRKSGIDNWVWVNPKPQTS